MTFKIFYISFFTLIALSACEKGGSNSDNPYDTWNSDPRGPVMKDLKIDPNTIEGLHLNIFKPTCANSGCHDGNFEPDFRSIESTYNSLVNRNAINYDPNNLQIAKRVVPGSAALSMVLHRINVFIPGTQGQMPLSLDPGSDWVEKKLQYIKNMENWINDGAKDQFGKSALNTDFTPQLGGLLIFANGSSTPLPRYAKNPIEIPPGASSLKIMMAYSDDKTAANNFGATSINFSTTPFEFLNPEKSMTVQSSPYNGLGIQGTAIDYWHTINISISDLNVMPNDVVWIRTQTSDNVNNPIFIPDVTADFSIKKYLAFHLN